MQQMSTPILFLFTLFPVLAITKQFGRKWGAIAGVAELALVVMTMKLWPKVFAGAIAMAVGVLMLIALAVAKDLRQRKTDRANGVEEIALADDPMASLFSASAARLRKYLPLFMVLGAGVCVLAQMHIFGGGEATSFLIAKGQYGEAAQVDFYRVFGFIPLIATTAPASGAYGIAGFTLVYTHRLSDAEPVPRGRRRRPGLRGRGARPVVHRQVPRQAAERAGLLGAPAQRDHRHPATGHPVLVR